MSAEEALARLAADLVEEIAAGRALELARAQARDGQTPASQGQGNVPAPAPVPWQLRRGAGAVHPQLGWHLVVMPGDTVSQHAYAHLMQPPGPPPGRSLGGGSSAPNPDAGGPVSGGTGPPRKPAKLP